MNIERPFDVYQHKAATYTELPYPAVQRPQPFQSASRSWALDALLRLMPTHLFQAGTPLDFEAYRAFPFREATHDSSP